MILVGVVVSGLGKGRYFLSIPHYRRLFEEITGFSPFPGTLNLLVGRDLILPVATRGIRLREAIVDGRLFGGAWAFPVRILGREDIPVWAVYPDMSAHPDQLELISDRSLRRALGLRDGDALRLAVGYPIKGYP